MTYGGSEHGAFVSEPVLPVIVQKM